MAVEGRRIRTAFVFVRELFRLRALADANDQEPRLNYGATTGAMLETVERYAYTEEVIGYVGDQEIHRRVYKPGQVPPDCMPVRNDSGLWARSTHSYTPASETSLLGVLERIWDALQPIERAILTLAQAHTYAGIVEELHRQRVYYHDKPITLRTVRLILEESTPHIEEQSLFRILAGEHEWRLDEVVPATPRPIAAVDAYPLARKIRLRQREEVDHRRQAEEHQLCTLILTATASW